MREQFTRGVTAGIPRRLALITLSSLALLACTDEDVQPVVADDAVLIADLSEEMQAVFGEFEIDPGILALVSPQARSELDIPGDEISPYFEWRTDQDHEAALADWQAMCLTEAGFPAFVEEETGAVVQQGEENLHRAAESEEDDLCSVEAVIRFPLRPSPDTPQEWQFFYDRAVTTARCVQGLGFDFEIPTLDQFIEGDGLWSGYDFVNAPAMSDEEWLELNGACPQ